MNLNLNLNWRPAIVNKFWCRWCSVGWVGNVFISRGVRGGGKNHKALRYTWSEEFLLAGLVVSSGVVEVKVSKKRLRVNAVQVLNMYLVNYQIPLSFGCKQMCLTPSHLNDSETRISCWWRHYSCLYFCQLDRNYRSGDPCTACIDG